MSPDSLLHLPDVREPAQYLIDMGLRPALARRLSNIYMDFVARYKQVFESYFRRAIQSSRDPLPDQYRDLFVVQFKGTIQALEIKFMSATWVWPCRAGPPTLFSPRSIDVRIPAFPNFCVADRPPVQVRVDAATMAQILSRLGADTTLFIMDQVGFYSVISFRIADFHSFHTLGSGREHN